MKADFHPKAFLTHKRNVKLGLAARTRILTTLERSPAKAKEIADISGLRYSSVLHHLGLLQVERVVTRRGSRPFVWQLTGSGQQRLSDPSH